MDSKNQILRYLDDTYSIRNILESFPPLNPDEPGVGKSVLAPWSIGSISLNTGLTENDVLEQLEDIPGARVEGMVLDGIQVHVLKMAESLGVQAHATHECHNITALPVYEAMNLHMFQFAMGKKGENDRPVKIEEAIFDLKNSVFLPDDFMPQHIMGMVEGDQALTTEELHKAYFLNADTRLLYLFHEQKGKSVGRVRFIYPAKLNFNPAAPSNEQIREKLTSSFAGLRSDEKYQEFESSRLLKTVLFNMEAKNTRELKRPVFDSRKINLLETMGLAEKTGDTARIRDEVSADRIKAMQASLKKRGEELSAEWLESIITLVN